NLRNTLARGGGDEHMRTLLQNYEGRIADLQQPQHAEAARPTALPVGTPAAKLELQVQNLLERIKQARARGMSDLQIESMETMLDGLRNGLRVAIEKLPGSVNKPGEQPKPKTKLQVVEETIQRLQEEIAKFGNDPSVGLRIDSREVMLAALVQEQRRLREAGETGEELVPVESVNAQEEIMQLEMALDQLGVGFDLMNDPRKVEEAAKLRKRLNEIKGKLPADATVRVESNGYGAESLEAIATAQTTQVSANARVITDPRVKEMLARYFGDTQEFKGAVRDPSLPRPQLNREMADELTEDVAAQFLTYLPGDANLPPELKGKVDQLKQSANNRLSQAWDELTERKGGQAPDPQDVFAHAKRGLNRDFLKTDEGAFAVMRDLRSLMTRGRTEGTISQRQFEKYEQFVNTSARELIDRANPILHAKTTTGNPKEDVVLDLFKSAITYADKQLAKERRNVGGNTLDRLAAVAQLGPDLGGIDSSRKR
ncbi:MAG: hypothetical protein ACT4TC_16305, partial [Myxococcaceae bacterium]